MASTGVSELASTIQSASLNRHPSPTHDLNPSTAASAKEPVYLSATKDEEHDINSSSDSLATDLVPYDAIRPAPRASTLPPLPDLRFEQSYLKSLEGTADWRGVAYVTVRDQVFLPLVQGMLWTLVLSGWRYWNRQSKLSGRGVGARFRRWWWRTNNWEIPSQGARRQDGKGVMEDLHQMSSHEM